MRFPVLLLVDPPAVSSFCLFMSKAAVNMHVDIFMWTCAFLYLGQMPSNEVAGSQCKYI